MRNLTIESVYPESKNKRRLLFTGVGKRGLGRPGKWVGVPFEAMKITANGWVRPVKHAYKNNQDNPHLCGICNNTRWVHLVTVPVSQNWGQAIRNSSCWSPAVTEATAQNSLHPTARWRTGFGVRI